MRTSESHLKTSLQKITYYIGKSYGLKRYHHTTLQDEQSEHTYPELVNYLFDCEPFFIQEFVEPTLDITVLYETLLVENALSSFSDILDFRDLYLLKLCKKYNKNTIDKYTTNEYIGIEDICHIIAYDSSVLIYFNMDLDLDSLSGILINYKLRITESDKRLASDKYLWANIDSPIRDYI